VYLASQFQPEELLIDFHEIIGEHSSANLAKAVWNTLELYGLKDWVQSTMLLRTGIGSKQPRLRREPSGLSLV
jgi:hypothetical protein